MTVAAAFWTALLVAWVIALARLAEQETEHLRRVLVNLLDNARRHASATALAWRARAQFSARVFWYFSSSAFF